MRFSAEGAGLQVWELSPSLPRPLSFACSLPLSLFLALSLFLSLSLSLSLPLSLSLSLSRAFEVPAKALGTERLRDLHRGLVFVVPGTVALNIETTGTLLGTRDT